MAYSLSSLIKLTREELANIVLDYQHKFDNSLGSINAELLELKTKFTKMESDLAISRNVNVNLVERLVVTERKYQPMSNIQGGNVSKFQAFLNQ